MTYTDSVLNCNCCSLDVVELDIYAKCDMVCIMQMIGVYCCQGATPPLPHSYSNSILHMQWIMIIMYATCCTNFIARLYEFSL